MTNNIANKKDKTRLVIVSNRLPVILTQKTDGDWQTSPGSGGLVTALAPTLRNRGGLWIGWPGTTDVDPHELEKALSKAARSAGFSLKAVGMSSDEKKNFYFGFANEVVWPLFHDFSVRCRFVPEYWQSYLAVNRRFAQTVQSATGPKDYIWIHDYHLMNVAQGLRMAGVQQPIGFFLHIPFPPLDIFLRLPWRSQVLQALMQYDLIGFQTLRYRRNFIQCARTLIKHCRLDGQGQVVRLRCGGVGIRLGVFPISIDFKEFEDKSATPQVADSAQHIRDNFSGGRIILGVDRLDYTKGIPERLEAFRTALVRYPELQGKICLVQVIVPSRHEIPEYFDLKNNIERQISEINGQFTRTGWVPIHYIYRNLERSDLVAYYRAAEIALITPLKDGMNLVAKEFCAASLEENCVLILSEFAGAAAQLQSDALLVNPYNIDEVADTIYLACKMRDKERRKRMRKLRATIRKQDIYWWVDSFLNAAFSRNLDSFPVENIEEYMPQFEVHRHAPDNSGI